jgi:hypothetical protein
VSERERGGGWGDTETVGGGLLICPSELTQHLGRFRTPGARGRGRGPLSGGRGLSRAQGMQPGKDAGDPDFDFDRARREVQDFGTLCWKWAVYVTLYRV